MRRELATAPGKIIALGEYAILEGASALVLAVNRRAIAYRAGADPPPLSRFLAAAEERCRELTGSECAEPIRVDTGALRVGDRKLGLGSSAAATVAYVAARLRLGGRDIDPGELHAICHQAHGDVGARENARGSGADVAAAVWGGVLKVTPSASGAAPTIARVSGDRVRFVAIDTGTPADTRALVSAVLARRDAGDHRYDTAIAGLAEAACAGFEALAAGDAGALAAAFEHGSSALETLGAAAGLELVTDVHREIAQTARNHGGAAKPTGAGGGDAALAVFADEANAERFCGDLEARGIKPLDLDVDDAGVLDYSAKATVKR